MNLRAWSRTAGLLVLGICATGSRVEAQRSRRADAVLVHDGRAMQAFGGSPEGSAAYAATLNTIHEAVGNRATIYSIIVPTAQEFYSPQQTGRERANILGTYARLAPAIRRVDAHAEIAAHTQENLYFRTDTHWTGLGGYYAYRAFCTAAGVAPVPLERMERRILNPSWLGSLYRLTRDRSLQPDQVEIVVPPARAQVIAGGRRGPEREVPLFQTRAPGYSVFLGGDHPIMRLSTSTQNGRRAILVKNSYGNAFAVHLVSHYQELVFVDYRTFQGSLIDLLGESNLPTDLVFINGALTANSAAASRMILELLRGRS